MLWWFSSFVRKEKNRSLFTFSCGPKHDTTSFAPLALAKGDQQMFPSQLPVPQHIWYTEDHDFSLLTDFLWKAPPFLLVHSASSPALPPVLSGPRQREVGWLGQPAVSSPHDGLGHPAARAWPHGLLHSSSSSRLCELLLCSPLPRVALFPVYSLLEDGIQAYSCFLSGAEEELREQDVEIQRCIRDRGRKKNLLAVISALLVFPFFKPRKCYMFFLSEFW